MTVDITVNIPMDTPADRSANSSTDSSADSSTDSSADCEPAALPLPPSYFPRVSVVVPIYNGEQDLPGLLDCLMAQTYPPEQVEYLLVDNGSRDRTPQILAAAADQFTAKGLTFKALSETNIQSAYAARNTGIRAATGEFLAFTDADCYPQPGWLTALMQPFADDSIGLVAGEITAFPGTTLLESYAERKHIMSQQDTLAHKFCPYGQTANLGIRLTALVEVGLFRPYLTTGGDADICWRLQRDRPWKIHYAADATIQHRHRQTLKELYAQWYRYGKSNRYLHELHGINLAWRLSNKEQNRSLLRWLLKDMPKAALKYVLSQGPAVDMLMIPLDIYCSRARDLGQQAAKLPDEARQIAKFAHRDPVQGAITTSRSTLP
jgi:cellulose synthase/poly-beta-1,6-N-acetylglucosamine synthase-like glycosyltransferase